ncbi:MAG: choice-of-anchor J domain-containing protein [Crocinitomicaceae bacterium]|nr:choice-of-anchor J domain-containing protein [Crocinitomicaceae bacterium]
MKKTAVFIALLIGMQSFAQTEIYNEDFQTGLPIDYSIVDNDGLTPDVQVVDFANAWIELVDPENPLDTIMGSTSFFDPAGQADRWLITPAITLGTYGNFLYWEAKSHDASFPDSYYVMASSTDTQLSSFTDTIAYISGELSDWNAREANLSDHLLDGQTVYIAFVNRTNDGFKLYMDDIRVVIDDPVGISELNNTAFTVYPNPTSGNISIKSDLKVKNVTIYGLDGALLVSQDNSNTINLEGLAGGRYLISVVTEEGVFRTSVVKY